MSLNFPVPFELDPLLDALLEEEALDETLLEPLLLLDLRPSILLESLPPLDEEEEGGLIMHSNACLANSKVPFVTSKVFTSEASAHANCQKEIIRRNLDMWGCTLTYHGRVPTHREC